MLCSAAFSHVQHSRPCDYKYMYNVGGGERGCWVVSETIYCRTFTLWMGPDSVSTKLIDHPKKNAWGWGGLRKINSRRKILFKVTFKTRRFCIAFYESYHSTDTSFSCLVSFLLFVESLPYLLAGRARAGLSHNPRQHKSMAFFTWVFFFSQI